MITLLHKINIAKHLLFNYSGLNSDQRLLVKCQKIAITGAHNPVFRMYMFCIRIDKTFAKTVVLKHLVDDHTIPVQFILDLLGQADHFLQ